jgi:hypothetical protein
MLNYLGQLGVLVGIDFFKPSYFLKNCLSLELVFVLQPQ